jgi:hypothetical protein
MLVFMWPDGRRQIVDHSKKLQRFERTHPTRRAAIYKCIAQRIEEVTSAAPESPQGLKIETAPTKIQPR